MDLKVPIVIVDELADEVITSTGLLNLASGEIDRVEYQDYDFESEGLPFENEEYEFTCGTLSNNGKDVEFRIDVNTVTGQYSVSASELLEIKVRAAALFAGVSGPALAVQATVRSQAAGAAEAPPTASRKTGKPGKPGSGGSKFH